MFFRRTHIYVIFFFASNGISVRDIELVEKFYHTLKHYDTGPSSLSGNQTHIVASTFLVKIKITFFKDNRLVYRDGYQKSKLFITNALEFIRLISAITKYYGEL